MELNESVVVRTAEADALPQKAEANLNLPGEYINLITSTWKGLTVTSGLIAGIFQILSQEERLSIAEVAVRSGYDEDKLDKWFHFAEKQQLVIREGNDYSLSPFGKFFSPLSPSKELSGFCNLTEFFLDAVLNAKETFKKGKSVDALTKGKISCNYQPRVSDNFSSMLVPYLREYGVKDTDSLLDIGCGNGAFLRILANAFPDMKLAGFDANSFAIEKGTETIASQGLSERINLFVSDAKSQLDVFENESYDWVTAFNVLHFYPPEKRKLLVDEMVRISKKGVFINEGILEVPFSSQANALMSMLWNDFTGFFKDDQLEDYNSYIASRHQEHNVKFIPVIQGTSILVIIQKTSKTL